MDIAEYKLALTKKQYGLDSNPTDQPPRRGGIRDAPVGKQPELVLSVATKRAMELEANSRAQEAAMHRAQAEAMERVRAAQKEDNEEPPHDWEAPEFDDLRTFESIKQDIIESLRDPNPKIIYDSKKAKNNFREMVNKIGNLYQDYLLLEK